MTGPVVKLLALVRAEEVLEQLVRHVEQACAESGAARVHARRSVDGPPVPHEFRSAQGDRAPAVAVLAASAWAGSWQLELPATAADVYLVEENVLFERTTPFDRRSGAAEGFTRMGSQSRAPGLDRAAFVAHWRDRHAVLVERHQPGISRYVQNVVLEQIAGLDAGVDGFHESRFSTVDAYRQGLFDSPEGRAALARDTAVLLRDAQQEERLFLREGALDTVPAASRW